MTIPDNIRYKRNLLRRRRAKLPPQTTDYGGIFLVDPDARRETFVDWDTLHYMCKDMMDPRNAHFAEDMGKVDWRKDPTYNMNRRRKP